MAIVENTPDQAKTHPKTEQNFDQTNNNNNNNNDDDEKKGDEKEMRELEEMLSKLNPMAKEFVPTNNNNNNVIVNNNNNNSVVVRGNYSAALDHGGFVLGGYIGNNNNSNMNGFMNNYFVMQQQQQLMANPMFPPNAITPRKKMNFNQGKSRPNSRTARTTMAQKEDVIRRTVYVSEIDHQVTEEQLAGLFIGCGQVVDCRICGDPNSVLRFAFIEFTDEEGARNALSLSGTMLGYYPVRVLPSKTAIAPVNPVFLPRSEDEREMCARTIYCANIDKKVTQSDVKLFFESICGEVYRLRLLGDYHHSTRIAFVEFVMAESAIAALNCSGAVLGTLPIRVSPSKTPVRPRAPPRPSMH